MHADDIRAALANRRQWLATADETRQQAMDDIAQLAHDGTAAGLTVTEVAQIVGMSRQTIHTMLNNKKEPTS